MNLNCSLSQASVLIESAVHYRSILHGLDDNRIKVYKIYYSRPFKYGARIALFILLMLPFFEWPSSLTFSCDLRFPISRPKLPCGILESIEFLCLCVFLFRACLLGYLFFNCELKSKKWLLGEFIIIFISLVDLLVSICLSCNEFYRIRRFLRPYFLISNTQMLKKTMKCLWNTIPEVTSFLLLLLLWLVNATLAAMCLFSGPLRSADLNTTLHFQTKPKDIRWFYDTFYSLIVLLTTANHPDIMMAHYNRNRLSAIFFVLFLAIGMYLFMNILTAIMFNQFRGYLSSSVQSQLFRRRVAVRAAFELLTLKTVPVPVVKTEQIIQVIHNTTIPNWMQDLIVKKLEVQYDSNPLTVNQFMDVFRLLDVPCPTSNSKQSCRINLRQIENRIQSFIISKIFTRISFAISILNVFIIATQIILCDQFTDETVIFFIVNWCFAVFYILEQVALLWAYGCGTYFSLKINYFDFAIVLFNLLFRIFETGLLISQTGKQINTNGWSPYDIGQFANLLILVRTLSFAQAFSGRPVIISTLLQLPKNIAPVLGILMSIYYIYALLGLNLFHDSIHYESLRNISMGSDHVYTCGTFQQLDYWSINFNDFAASLIVLWSLMIVNNWYVIVRAFKEELGQWVHLYMISWWLIVAVVMINLVTAMVIESFMFAHYVRDRKMQLRKIRSNRLGNSVPKTESYRCGYVACCSFSENAPDNESLLPGFEEPMNTSEHELTTFDNSSDELILPCFSFAELFSDRLHEPSNEEIFAHLIRHPYLSNMINQTVNQY